MFNLRRKAIFLTSSLSLFFFAFITEASAHVKWFVDSPNATVLKYSLFELPVLSLLAIVVGTVIVTFILDRLLTVPENFRPYLVKLEGTVTTLLSILVGVALIVSSSQRYLFAPNLEATAALDSIFVLVQAVLGVALLLGIFTRVAAAGLLLLYLAVSLRFGLVSALETFEVAGIGIFLFVNGRPAWKLFDINPAFSEKIKDSSLASLRIFTGLNLFVLGFSEKILNPGLGQAFLHEHPWNFMKLLGFESFSDRTFVLFAGGFEALFGLLLVLGLVTRLTGLALAVFFITTLILLGPVELIGHLPLFAIVFVLLVYGSGKGFKLGNSASSASVLENPGTFNQNGENLIKR